MPREQVIKAFHQPVMAEQVREWLIGRNDALYVDGTVGEGGHALHILETTPRTVQLVGLDVDSNALEKARFRLAPYRDRLELYQESYDNLGYVLEKLARYAVSGILLDLGFSSLQIEDPDRGFSFTSQKRLDMRFDARQSVTAYDIVNGLSCGELKDLFYKFGEERYAGAVAMAILKRRSRAPIQCASDLAEIISHTVPWKNRKPGIHPATRIFQALRIAVNRELEHLERFLYAFPRWLESKGRIVIISYHSIEDRLVKRAFRFWSSACRCSKDLPQCICSGKAEARILTHRPITPSHDEIERNPRSRSAKMRVVERI